MPQVKVKICGLRTPADFAAAADAGASYGALNFFAKSPRSVSIETAADLAARAPGGLTRVGLVVNPDDEFLSLLMAQVDLDMLQLHGSETPARVAEVRLQTGLPVMKAISIGTADDVRKIDAYAQVADRILVDAKPPPASDLPGGTGVTFDWSLIADVDWQVPWMLAGGLTPETVGDAVRQTGAIEVDVASGVERAPGEKDHAKMAAFVRAAQA